MKSIHPLRAALAAEAEKHGFILDYSDLRSGLFFIARGTEVRRGWIWRGIDSDSLNRAVDRAVKDGTRIDQIKGSRYFVEPLRVRLCTPVDVHVAASLI